MTTSANAFRQMIARCYPGAKLRVVQEPNQPHYNAWICSTALRADHAKTYRQTAVTYCNTTYYVVCLPLVWGQKILGPTSEQYDSLIKYINNNPNYVRWPGEKAIVSLALSSSVMSFRMWARNNNITATYTAPTVVSLTTLMQDLRNTFPEGELVTNASTFPTSFFTVPDKWVIAVAAPMSKEQLDRLKMPYEAVETSAGCYTVHIALAGQEKCQEARMHAWMELYRKIWLYTQTKQDGDLDEIYRQYQAMKNSGEMMPEWDATIIDEASKCDRNLFDVIKGLTEDKNLL